MKGIKFLIDGVEVSGMDNMSVKGYSGNGMYCLRYGGLIGLLSKLKIVNRYSWYE